MWGKRNSEDYGLVQRLLSQGHFCSFNTNTTSFSEFHRKAVLFLLCNNVNTSKICRFSLWPYNFLETCQVCFKYFTTVGKRTKVVSTIDTMNFIAFLCPCHRTVPANKQLQVYWIFCSVVFMLQIWCIRSSCLSVSRCVLLLLMI